jgi:ribosome maturation factor RimP
MPLHLPQKMNQQKGNGVRSLLLCPHFHKLELMDNTGIITTVTQWINDLLANRPGFFLVQVRIKPTNNLKVFIDADQGVSIDDCIKLNRPLYKVIEEAKIFPDDDFSLEVSSPGVGEPLLMLRQYTKNMGRWLQVKMVDGPVLEGTLKEATEDGILLEVTTGKGKKAVTEIHSILFEQIKEASVQVKW